MRERGFTLPEMLVVVAIVAVTTMIAVPSFTGLMQRSALSSKLNDMVGAMHLARSEAITRQARVVLCRRNSDGTDTCDTAGGWQNGWLVFVDTNIDGDIDTGETILGNGAAVNDITFKNFEIGALVRIPFRPDGTAFGVGADRKMIICKGTTYEGEITLNATGRPKVTRGYPYTTLVNCP